MLRGSSRLPPLAAVATVCIFNSMSTGVFNVLTTVCSSRCFVNSAAEVVRAARSCATSPRIRNTPRFDLIYLLCNALACAARRIMETWGGTPSSVLDSNGGLGLPISTGAAATSCGLPFGGNACWFRGTKRSKLFEFLSCLEMCLHCEGSIAAQFVDGAMMEHVSALATVGVRSSDWSQTSGTPGGV
eukprot:378695-Amphidinium_carterae.1